MILPPYALPKMLALTAVLVAAPALGLRLSRANNVAAQVSAPNGVVGSVAAAAASVAAASGPAAVLAPNDFAGVLLPPRMANLAPRAEGRVESVAVKVGQRVRRGDVIVRFDPRQGKHDLAMAQASLRAAQAAGGAASSEMQAARRRAARRNATVQVDGHAVTIVSGEEAAQAQFDARTASARAVSAGASVAEAQARVRSLALALEETEIKAPFDGVVTTVLFEPGMSVHANETVARVVGGAGLRLRFAVAEEDAAFLRGRTRARVTLDSSVLFATIEQIAPEVEPASRMFFVEGPVIGGDAACGDTGCAMVTGRGVRVALEAVAP